MPEGREGVILPWVQGQNSFHVRRPGLSSVRGPRSTTRRGGNNLAESATTTGNTPPFSVDPFQKPFGEGVGLCRAQPIRGSLSGYVRARSPIRCRGDACWGVQGRAGLGSRLESLTRVADLRKPPGLTCAGPPSVAAFGCSPRDAAAAWEGAARQRLVRTSRRPGPGGRAGESILRAPRGLLLGPCLVASAVPRLGPPGVPRPAQDPGVALSSAGLRARAPLYSRHGEQTGSWRAAGE